MWKLGRSQVWKKQRLFFCRPKKGDDCVIWLQHLVVAISYTCGLPILHTGLDSVSEKKHPIERLLGIRQLQLTSLLNPPAQARDVCSWQCEQLPNENPWHSMNHEPYWLVHLPGSLVHGLWNMKKKTPILLGWSSSTFLQKSPGSTGHKTSWNHIEKLDANGCFKSRHWVPTI